MKTKEANKCIVVTAPSGAGKTTIVKHLMKTFPNQLGFSVSATTRTPRGEEVDGKDYHFFTIEEFQQNIDEKAFVEYEEVYQDRYYGTLRSELVRLWNQNKTILFDIDVQGAMKLKKELGGDCMAIFILPPKESVLIDRLTHRKTETADDLKMRKDKIKNELSYKNCFDKILVNDVLETTLKEAEVLVKEFLSSEGK